MKKQEMIDLILKQEREMWNDLLECVHKLGTDDPLTDLASARYGVINQLALKIVKK